MIDNDLDLLPEEFRPLSLSPREIVLLYEEALRAIEILRRKGIALLGWEGWVLYPDGKRGHPLPYILGTPSIDQGPDELWQEYVSRSCRVCVETIDAEHMSWEQAPLLPDVVLYFCITCGREPRSNP